MEFRFKLVLLVAVLALSAGISFACQADTYNDTTYTHVKKLFEKDETVYLKGTGIGADSKCFDSMAAKVEYYPPGSISPEYTHTCTSSTCYFPHEASGSVKDSLELETSDLSGLWTAKVYRGKHNKNGSCSWEYRATTTFNVTNFDYSCSIGIVSPEEGEIFLAYYPVAAIGRVICDGRPLNPDDFYVQVEWAESQFSPGIPLEGEVGGDWLFTTSPDNNHFYGESGEEKMRARLYRKCVLENSTPCDYIVSTSGWRNIFINAPPVSVPSGNGSVALGETAYFDGSASFDTDGEIVLYSWGFGDGENASGATAGHAYSSIGVYAVTLIVTDNLGATSENSIRITVGSPVAEYVAISPENATLAIGGTRGYSAAAHDSHGNEWDVTGETSFSSEGGEFEENVFTAGTVGTYAVYAYYGDLSASTFVTIINAEAERIEIAPENASVVAGGTLFYSATAYDGFGNSWDVTSETDFSSEGGGFISNLFSAGSVAGTFEVNGTYGGLSDKTNVLVVHGPAVSISVSPENIELPPLSTENYTATASDEHGNEWDVTGETIFSSDGGTFEENILTAGTAAGNFTVLANYSDLTDSGELAVVPGELVSLEIFPRNITLAAGSSRPYTAVAYDEHGNGVDVTGETAFSSDGGNFSEDVFTAGTAPGDYIITGIYGRIESEMILMSFMSGTLEASTPVHVTTASAASISIAPKTATITAGGTQAYSATASDGFGNQWDVTYDTAFISEAGTFSENVLTSDGSTGTFEVVGEYGELTDYATITVNQKATEPSKPGNSGGSGFGYDYRAGGTAQPPPKSCQKLGDVCSETVDCCEGACISGACAIPEAKPPAKRLVEVIAPSEANVGESVEVKLRYIDNGEPVKGADLQVIAPSYDIIPLETDENGVATYVPSQEGWHDYLVPNYEVWGITSTFVRGNVSDPGRVTIIRYLTRTASTNESGFGPLTGLFLGNLAPEVLGLIVLVLLLTGYGAYLYYREQQEPEIVLDVEPLVPMKKLKVKKPRKPPEVPPELPQPAQPEQPQNPT